MKNIGVQANRNSPHHSGRIWSKLLYLLAFVGFLGLLSHIDMGPVEGRWLSLKALLVTRNLAYLPAPKPAPEADLAEIPSPLPAPPAMSEGEAVARVDAEQVLNDPLDRISEEFTIPEGLSPRVKFWFDVYTKYGQFTHIIHHTKYPWIVYEVLDFGGTVDGGRGPKWLRVDRAKKFVQRKRADIRMALRRLAKNPSKKKSDLEVHLSQVLASIPGKRSTVYKEAAEMLRSQLGQRDFFIQGLRRSSRYFPYLEDSFRQSDLPLDLTRMPFVESSFNELAESKVGASGIWQVMPATGRAYGLVNINIDERNSPYKATQMAARLLRSYHRALGSWPLAVTAYNHGIGNIEIAIRAARSRDLAVIIQRYHRGDFKFASSNFYTCFLAALYAERYSEIVFPSVVREPALPHERFQILRPISLAQLVRAGGLIPKEIFEYNLDLNRTAYQRIQLPRGYVLHLPPGTAGFLPDRLRSRLKTVPTLPSQISELNLKSKPAG